MWKIIIDISRLTLTVRGVNRKMLSIAILIAAIQTLSLGNEASISSPQGITTANTSIPTATSRTPGMQAGLLEKTISVVYFLFAGATVVAGIGAIYLHRRRDAGYRRKPD